MLWTIKLHAADIKQLCADHDAVPLTFVKNH